jgi:hypothetical protein
MHQVNYWLIELSERLHLQRRVLVALTKPECPTEKLATLSRIDSNQERIGATISVGRPDAMMMLIDAEHPA